MEAIQKEYERLNKRANLSKSIKDVDHCLRLLENAREAILRDPTTSKVTLVKLQQAMSTGLSKVQDDHKEIYTGLNRYGKALDKTFKAASTYSTTDYDALTSQAPLIKRAIAMHLIREGQFSVADCFVTEAGPIDIPPELQQEFQEMYEILDAMRTRRDLSLAIGWAHQKSVQLEQRGSNLEFELCKLQFIWLFIELPDRAMAYARREFSRFQEKHLKDIQQLMCAFLFLQSPEKSPYSRIFADPEKSWNDVAHSFTKEFCSLLGLSAESPLYIAATAGAIALPTLLKMASIMKEKKTEWSTVNELPAEIALPPGYQFHSIFVCPVSKDQTTDSNPPMMLPCGHVIAQESLQRLAKGGSSVTLKCPYCPRESSLHHAKPVII
ncbi:CTLH/CRA C-terminal to lish motif domain-domain-containing protein [Tuber borchii]|uniref:GID complex catalytic subunit 2 n=1 Tax=Tuber borchii TaxID=42251 RepID=A0A2T7A2C5_TUBBO|nr:CTLH/CRA C-terminal to lish motif domain-domain-containing protein [Tuber borchii]